MNFPEGRYSVIYIDPPWKYNIKKTTPYSTMNFEDICKLNISKIAENNCALFLWITCPQLPLLFPLLKSWGFEYKTIAFVWVKRCKKSWHKWFFGQGYYTRANAELCILATKGKPKRIKKGISQIIDTPVMEHSRKPFEVEKRIKQLFRGPYIELFARQEKKGWVTWGNETVFPDIKGFFENP